jgi:hypothetical protein
METIEGFLDDVVTMGNLEAIPNDGHFMSKLASEMFL